MLDAIGKLGMAGSVGFLIGIGVITWVRPTTDSGAVLLVAISIVFSLMIGGIITRLLSGNREPTPPAAVPAGGAVAPKEDAKVSDDDI
jgi:hypothetical protein